MLRRQSCFPPDAVFCPLGIHCEPSRRMSRACRPCVLNVTEDRALEHGDDDSPRQAGDYVASLVSRSVRASPSCGPRRYALTTTNSGHRQLMRREGERPLVNGLRLVQVPKIICAKFKTARTRFNIAAFAKPTCADFDSINSSTPFAAVPNGCIA